MRARVVVALSAVALAAGSLPPAASAAPTPKLAIGAVLAGRAPVTSTVAAVPVDRRFRLLGLSIDRRVVDVTRASRKVTITLKVSHPRGVVEGELTVGLQNSVGSPYTDWGASASPTMISSSGRTARFRTTLVVPRYAEPSTFDIGVGYVNSRNPRNPQATVVRPRMLTVVDRDPDTAMPRIVSLRLRAQGGFPVDPGADGARVRVVMRITDDRSGIDLTRSTVVLRAVDPLDRIDQSYEYVTIRRISGTARDGIWAGSVRLPRVVPGGDWDTQVVLFDTAHDSGQSYSGGLLRDYLPLPGGAGPFLVRARGDKHRPVLVSATVTPSRIPADGVARDVVVEARVDDRGAGVESVTAVLDAPWADIPARESRHPTSGTSRSGVWRFTFRLEPGSTLPGGPVWLHLRVADRNHITWYRAPGAPALSPRWTGERTLTAAQLRGGTGRLDVP